MCGSATKCGSAPQCGFSLVELLAAVAVLTLSVAAGTGVLGLALATDGEGRRCRTDRDAAVELLWSFETMPYCTDEGGAASLVSLLFPHAVVARNREDAFYCPTASPPWPAVSFVTRHEVGGRAVVVVARFLARDADGLLRVVDEAGLTGIDLVESVPPPALFVEVRPVGSSGGSTAVARLFVADALWTAGMP